MKRTSLAIIGIGSVCLLGGCTERRTASDPVPDGDTIEVVLPDRKAEQEERAIRIIETESLDTAVGITVEDLLN